VILDRSLPLDQVPNLIIQICEALSAIHRSQIIHRDLKPTNIVIQDDGSVKITDFGIARPENSELTKHNEIIGSVHYISPENWIGKELTASVDLYSLGVILYEVVTGHPPYQADTAAKLMRQHLDGVPVPPRELNAGVAPWLNKLILRLLEKSPLDRPRSADEIIDEVRTRASISGASLNEESFEECSIAFLQNLESQWERTRKPAIEGPHTGRSPEPPEIVPSTITEKSVSLFRRLGALFKGR
jgi:serine/threonine protein kinase